MNKSENIQTDNSYCLFLEKRIQECMDESKRYLNKYSELRSFAYNQIEILAKR